MDCEKFETSMIDELYDELDELTSAAAKRHVAGCARCAALLGGLRATRRLVGGSGGLSVEPPADLEDRILAAARDAQKVVPIQRRLSRVVSWAGHWAMKPQSQMAAVFLLMIGFSAFLLRGKHSSSRSAETAGVTVTEQGAPAASALARADEESFDTRSSAAAHGTQDNKAKAMTTGAPATGASDPFAQAMLAAPTAAAPPPRTTPAGPMDELLGGVGREKQDKGGALAQALADDEDNTALRRAGPSNAGAIGGGGGFGAPPTLARKPAAPMPEAPGAAPPPPPPAPAVQAAPPAKVAASKGPSVNDDALKKEQRDRTEGKDSNVSNVTFGTAKAAFDSGSFGEATRQFDVIASTGDLNAALWAARSVRSGSGCSSAVSRFTQLASKAGSGVIGNDARLEAGQCLRQMGSFESARAQLVPLITVPSHGARAQRELTAMPPSAAARPAPRKGVDQQQTPYATPPQSQSTEKANGL